MIEAHTKLEGSLQPRLGYRIVCTKEWAGGRWPKHSDTDKECRDSSSGRQTKEFPKREGDVSARLRPTGIHRFINTILSILIVTISKGQMRPPKKDALGPRMAKITDARGATHRILLMAPLREH